MKRIGVVTIGQSPRTDLIADLEHLGGGDLELIETGALDDFTLAEVERGLAPTPGEALLVSRMRDGTQVRLAEERLLPLLQKRINELDAQGASPIVLFCTGQFPDFESEGLVLYPERILNPMVAVIAGARQLGVFSPDEKQLARTRQKWAAHLMQVEAFAASPYLGGHAFRSAAAPAAESTCDLFYLDCVGYSLRHKTLAQEVTGRRVLVAREMLLAVARSAC